MNNHTHSYTIKHEPAFTVVGITTRTSNALEMQGNGAIAQLWQKFFSEQLLHKISHKSDNDLIALYYDFENDKNGEYTVLLGARVDTDNSLDIIPEGMVAVQIPAEKKAVFTSEKGSFPAIVVDVWQKIWTLEDQSKLDRIYTFEYELYDERSTDPAHAQMEIHIAVK